MTSSKVISKKVQIPISEREEMSAYFASPERPVGPGVVMIQEIFGVNEAMRAKADKFAAEGFPVVVPDLFWRIQPNIQLGYSEAERKEAFGYLGKFDFKAGLDDLSATISWMMLRPESKKKVALVGFCIGGKLAVVGGAMNPTVSAVISFYGVKLDENLEQIRALKCPLQLHIGDNDSHIPRSTIELLDNTVASIPSADLFVYKAAQHGFFNLERSDVFDKAASTLAFDRIKKALLAHT